MNPSSIVILGIDPGSRITGYGLIEVTAGNQRYLASGCLRLKAQDSNLRLQQIFTDLQAIINYYQPHEIAIERVFMHHKHANPAAAIKLGQARGAALVAVQQALAEAVQCGQTRQLAEYSAREIKQAVVGHGAAKKEQVQFMVRALLKLSDIPQSDAADALAAALCHSHVRTLGGLPLSTKRKKRRWR